MSYGGDPLNDPLDAIRCFIGDTGDDPEYTDDEIYYYYTISGSTLLAASRAAAGLAAKCASRVSKSIGSRSIQNDQLFQHYSALANALQERYNADQNGSISAPPINQIKDSIPTNFPSRQKLSDINHETFGDDTS